jgi:PAS domain S-box-containing protein
MAKQSITQSAFLYLDTQPLLFHYALAMVTVTAALLATLYTPVIGERTAFMLFYFAIIQSTFWLGRNPGICAIVLSLIAINAFILFPIWASAPYDAFILNAGFSILSVVIIGTTNLHRRSTTALWKSQKRYSEIVESARDAIITIDANQTILVFNLAAEDMFSCTANDAIGKPIERFIPECLRFEHCCTHNHASGFTGSTNHKTPELYAMTGLRTSGEKFPIEATISCCETSSRKTFTVILRDVSERLRTQAALRESEAQLALVVEEVKAGYWDWDLISHTLYFSPEWKQQIGMDEKEMLNSWEEWGNRLHPDDREPVLTAIENYVAERQPVFDMEFRLHHQDGSYRWIHSRGGLLRDSNNHPYRMLGINLDITDYKKAKELNLRRDLMEQAFRLYVASQTAVAIAHEMNQPLTALSSYIDLALTLLQNGNQDPPKLFHILKNCSSQTHRASEVIQQLMNVLHKGGTVIETIDMNHSILEAVDFIKMNGYLGVFKLEMALADGLPLVVANGLQVQKILTILLQNGLESMQESGRNTGTVTVTSRCFADDPSMVHVTVCDTGIGVKDTAALKLIFHPFYTTKSAGLGMGLAVSRALIEAHNGKIWVEQNAGFGISIHFTLPFVYEY